MKERVCVSFATACVFIALASLPMPASSLACYNKTPSGNFVELDAPLRKAIVRVYTSRLVSDVAGSGSIIQIRKDKAPKKGALIIVLTADHVVANYSSVRIGMGDGDSRGYLATHVERHPLEAGGTRVDLALVAFRVPDLAAFQTTYGPIEPFSPGIKRRDGILLCGYGNYGVVDQTDMVKRYWIMDEFGRYRNGHAAENEVAPGGFEDPSTGEKYAFTSYTGKLQFAWTPPLEPDFGEGFLLEGDSGGPSLQWTIPGRPTYWPLLVGVHAAFQDAPLGFVAEGYRQFDVLVSDYLDWILGAAAAIPQTGYVEKKP